MRKELSHACSEGRSAQFFRLSISSASAADSPGPNNRTAGAGHWNRNFQSERLNGYELGYRRLLKSKLYLDIASFFNQYRNLLSENIAGPIFLEDTPAPPHLLLPAEFGNGLVATTEGGEIAPEWQPTKFWRLTGWYSFLEMHVKKAPGSADLGSARGARIEPATSSAAAIGSGPSQVRPKLRLSGSLRECSASIDRAGVLDGSN